MKAIILTNCQLQDQEQFKKLRDTEIFKMALNQHGEEYNPDIRICTDYQNWKTIYFDFLQPLVSVRAYPKENYLRLIKGNDVEFRGSTIVAGIEWLYLHNYKTILLVADNTVHGEIHQETVNNGIQALQKLYPDIEIYQFTKGNFRLKQKSITQFIKE